MKQPAALLPIFFTELWERFGYYAIQGLLVLFLVHRLDYSPAYAFLTLSEFVSWAYVTPLLGGLVADRLLGHRYSILIGTLLLAAGYFILAFFSRYLLHMSLAFIIIGNGLLKPNSAAFLGQFYYHDDPRRYPGFTTYFIAINLGGLLSVVITSLAIGTVGYTFAFACAAIGMLIAALVFFNGFRHFENRGKPKVLSSQSPILKALSSRIGLILITMTLIQAIHFLLHTVRISEATLVLLAFGVIAALYHIQSEYNKTTRKHLSAIILLTGASIVFWAIQLQIFFSVILFTENKIQRTWLGHTIPAPFFIILEPLFLVMLGPLLARIWEYRSHHDRELSPATKFTYGLFATSLAMATLSISCMTTGNDHLIHPIWLVVFYGLLAIGSLMIMPTGLAMITELAPEKLMGLVMGIWYMVIGLGGLLAGVLAQQVLYQSNDFGIALLHNQYGKSFALYAGLALLIAVVLSFLSPQLKKLMQP